MTLEFYTKESVKKLDKIAIEQANVEGYSLMQRAGEFAFKVMQEKWPVDKKIWIFTGVGNNGGDGFVVATLAKQKGLEPIVILCGDDAKLSGDAQLAFIECKNNDVKIINHESADSIDGIPDVVVDAIFGTGLSKPLQDNHHQIIEFINSINAKKLAIDVPSGLDANTGMPLNVAFKADLTVTFVGKKQGLYTGKASDYCGEIIFSDLQISNNTFSEVKSSGELISLCNLKQKLKSQFNASHKKDFGHVAVIGGNLGMLGASILASKAALRAGAGLVTAITKPFKQDLISIHMPEIMSKGAMEFDFVKEFLLTVDAIVIGPGLGQDEWAVNMLQGVLSLDKKLVIDADALNLLAGMKSDDIKKIEKALSKAIITPHPGEAARLLGLDSQKIQVNRFLAIEKLNAKFGSTVVLKGAGSIVYGSNNKFYITTNGNNGMSSAGMGDILSGVAGALLARDLSEQDAACLAISAHAEAGDREIINGKRGMIASDLLKWIRLLLN